jgi:hypothetical protein
MTMTGGLIQRSADATVTMEHVKKLTDRNESPTVRENLCMIIDRGSLSKSKQDFWL